MMRHRDLVQYVKGRLSRRAFITSLSAASFSMAGQKVFGKTAEDTGTDVLTLENEAISLTFARSSGSLKVIENKLTRERIGIDGDDFRVGTQEFVMTPQNSQLVSLQKTSVETVEANYSADGQTVTAIYKLGSRNRFFEKHLILTRPLRSVWENSSWAD